MVAGWIPADPLARISGRQPPCYLRPRLLSFKVTRGSWEKRRGDGDGQVPPNAVLEPGGDEKVIRRFAALARPARRAEPFQNLLLTRRAGGLYIFTLCSHGRGFHTDAAEAGCKGGDAAQAASRPGDRGRRCRADLRKRSFSGHQGHLKREGAKLSELPVREVLPAPRIPLTSQPISGRPRHQGHQPPRPLPKKCAGVQRAHRKVAAAAAGRFREFVEAAAGGG